MIRLAATSYLIFAFTVGQAAFCFVCCTLKACAAPSPSTAASTPHVRPLKPVPSEGRGGCPHCSKHQKESVGEKSPTGESDGKNRCPCKERRAKMVALELFTDHVRGWSLEDDFPALGVGDALSGVTPDLSVLTKPMATPGLRDGPWLSADDLRSFHHVIRC